MAPNLRFSSHARSNNSRPSTPADAQAAASTASSFTESTRPRKQRRTGRHSRVATDPPDETLSQDQSQQAQPETENVNTVSASYAFGDGPVWEEPPVRPPLPSYADTPWSAVSSDLNPVLATMRPLGAMPTAADLRKAGLTPAKPSAQNIPAKNEPQVALNGESDDGKLQTPLTPAAEPMPEPAPLKVRPEDDLLAFTAIPVPASTKINVEKIKVAVENALTMASETDNRPVIRGLLRLWEKCGKDSFALSVLEGICGENPGPRERSAFQSVMRAAWKEVRSEVAEPEPTPATTMARTRSASSVSSLSSAKSLDVETFAPGMAPGAVNSRSRAKGKQAKAAAQKAKATLAPPAHHSSFPLSEVVLKRRREMEENSEFSAESLRTKRTRLQRSLPRLSAPESRLRSSLTSLPPSNASTPGPTALNRSQITPSDVLRNRGVRSESSASSDAGDNRRLTPVLSSRDERSENNDFCRECNGNGQLLCCDGCVDSFHFSCLNPPLDPANPPEGDWYCPKCSVSRPMGALLNAFNKTPRKDFALPSRLRDFFTGVRTGEAGRYEEIVPLPRLNPRGGRGNRTGLYDDPYLLRTMDSKGNLIFCTACGRTSNGRRPIIQCDFCPCAFHMDCVDPPLANPPNQRPGSDRPYYNWMCPNHVHHDLSYVVQDEEGYDTVKRIRRPKNPRLIDVEVLPDEDEFERIEDQESEGILYRVSEKGLKLDFVKRVRRENEEIAMKKAAADRYFEYASAKFDELTAQAHAFYSSQQLAVAEEDTTTAILNSRTVADREAAVNLMEFAQNHRISTAIENGRISLLIDQLRANAPNNLPTAETELESLRSLQLIIDQRIQMLTSQSPLNTQPASIVQCVNMEPANDAQDT
ncbi:hypothetical protein EYZ11_000559 [Aspergillus tanneri]|uniref:PHD-type domain-containing protein n=1 Tax=Aspergillus tanneri TaxID=1220188 RepID=A0A4V3UQS7_9EURO|nr:uncharacterized protein ATNIH1004_004038 [Aspergillus tanneri]KAA8648155.1 hypothetical protein ATNIH1004_004038 [Aspergillus tanneri]THC99980.1 hypothetical protein EYZ11_000559 [Aspergillus tanneri]